MLLPKLALKAGEIIDSTVLRKRALVAFYEEQIARAKREGLLLSLHLKATMMKVSDPIIFGHAVRVFFKDLLAKYSETFSKLGVDLNNGFGDLVGKIASPARRRKGRYRSRHPGRLRRGPGLSYVNSDNGITNLHVPSDVIVDASMPALIRAGGKVYDSQGKLGDTLALIPDSSYAGIYQTTLDFCRKHGAFDPKTMGSVPNVGLMAQAAEEYGSHKQDLPAGQRPARFASSTPPARSCSSIRSKRATSGALARPKTLPCKTGSSWPSTARASAARRPCSGSTKSAPTTRRSSPR